MARTIPATVEVGLIDRLSSPIARLQARVRAFSGRMGIGRLTAAVSDVGRAFNGLGAGLSRSMGRLGGIAAAAGLGAGGAGAALIGLTNQTASNADRLARLSGRLNIGFDTLQELAHAANLSGVEFSSLTSGIEGFGRRMGQALDGTKAPLEAFNRLNVPLRTTTGEIRDTEEVLDATLEALAGVEDAVERDRLAFEIFGRSGVDIVQMLNGGSEALAQMRQEARDLGLVLSEDFGQQATEYQNSLTRLRGRLHGLRTIIGVELLPVFNDVVLHVTAWLDANRDLIATKIEEWVRALTRTITALLDPTSDLRQSIAAVLDSTPVRLVRELVDRMGAFNAAMSAMTIYVLAPVAARIVNLAIALGKLMLAFAAIPVIGWIALAVAAVAGLAYVIYRNWGGIAASVSAGLEAAAGAIAGALNGIAALTASLVDTGADMAHRMLAGIAKTWSLLIAAIAAGIDSMFAGIADLRSRMFAIGVGIVALVQRGIAARLEGLRDVVMGWLSAVRDRFRIEEHSRRSPWDRRGPAPGHETDTPAGPVPEIPPLTSHGGDALPPGDDDLAPLMAPDFADRVEQMISAPVRLHVLCDGLIEDRAAFEAACREGAADAIRSWRERRLAGETLH